MVVLAPTFGTKTSMWLNFGAAILGALQGSTDLFSSFGPAGGWVVAAVGIANGILHMLTGNVPVVGEPVPGVVKPAA